MKRLSLLLTLVLAIAFIGCSNESGPSGPKIDAPTGLVATPQSATKVLLTWEFEGFTATGFVVERTVTGTDAWEFVAEPALDARSYADTLVSEGALLSYRIKAFRGQSESSPSNTDAVIVPPATPRSLTAVQNADVTTQINLSWVDSSQVETAYDVQRSLTTGQSAAFVSIAELSANSAAYSDTGLTKNTRYYYRVRAMLDEVPSAFSDEVSARTTVFTPAAPLYLEARPGGSGHEHDQIQLIWTLVSQNEDGIVVGRDFSRGGNFPAVDSLPRGSKNYTDKTLTSETTYFYRLYAYNSYGNSDFSDVVSLTTEVGPPLAPTNLRAVDTTHNSVTMQWDDNSLDELGFRVQFKPPRSSIWQDRATTGEDQNVYQDTDLDGTSSYSFRVASFKVAEGDTMWSAWSNVITVITKEGPPSPPTELVVTVDGLHQLRLSWVRAGGNPDNIIIERWPTPDGSQRWGNVDAIGGNLTSYLDGGLDINTWYKYRIKAFKMINETPFESEYSNVDSAATLILNRPLTVADDFENHALGQPPGAPWTYQHGGDSYVEVSNANPKVGSQCLHLVDSNPNAADTAFAWLTLQNIGSMDRGYIGCWIKISNGSTMVYYGASSDDYYSFQTYFNSNGIVYFRNGPGGTVYSPSPGIRYPVDQWFLLEFVFDMTTDTYDGHINGTQIFDDWAMQGRAATTRVGILAFSNTVVENGWFDNFILGVPAPGQRTSSQIGPIRPVAIDQSPQKVGLELPKCEILPR